MGAELSVALRINALLDQAKGAVRDFGKDIDALGKTGKDAGAELDGIGGDRTTANLNRAQEGAARTAREITKLQTAAMQTGRDMAAATEMGRAASDRYIQMLQRQFDVLGKNRSELEAYRAKALGLTESAQKEAAALGAKIDAWHRNEVAAKAAAKAEDQAMNAVSGHGAAASGAMKSLGIETVGAKRELLVLAHEAMSGNFSRMPGSMMVLAQRTNLATLAFKLIFNPITLSVAALGSFAVAAYKAAQESARLNTELIATGGFAGNSAGGVLDMSKRIGEAHGNYGTATEILTGLIATGRVSAAVLESTGRAATNMAKLTGEGADKMVAKFSNMSDGVTKFAEDFNRQYHMIGTAVLEQIDKLERQGEAEQAQQLLANTIANETDSRLVELRSRLSDGQKAWQDIGEAASEAGQKMKNAASIWTSTESHEAELAWRKQWKQGDRSLATFAGSFSDMFRGVDNDQRIKELEAQQAQDAASEKEKSRQKKTQEEGNQAYQALQSEIKQYDKNAAKAEELLKTKQRFLKLRAANPNSDLLKGVTFDGDNVSGGAYDAIVKGINKRNQDNSGFNAGREKAQQTIAQLQANFEMLKKTIGAGNAVIEQALKDGQITLEAAYAARRASLQTEAAAEKDVLQKEIEQVDAALARAVNPAQRGPLQQKRIGLVAKLDLVQQSLDDASRKLEVWKTGQEKELANITAKIKIDVSNLAGTFDRSAVEQQLKLQYEQDYKRAGALSDPAEQEAQRNRIDLLVQAGLAQAELNAKLQEAQRIQQQLAVQEGAINNEAQSGQISQIEGEARIKAAREAQLPALREIVEQLLKMRDALPAEAAAVIDQATVSIGQLQNQVAATTPVMVNFGTRARNSVIDGIADAAGNAVTNFENMGEAIKSTLKQIAGDIVRSNIKKILLDQFTPDGSSGAGSGLFGAIFSGIGSLFGFANGGSLRKVRGFSEGGRIRGPGTGTSDSISAIVDGREPIAVSNAEFIQPERAVKHYGLAFMEAIRTLQLPKPRFAFGGLIRAHQAARFATGGALKAAGASDGAMPALQINFINQGTPQRVVEQQQTMNGKDVIVNVVLADLTNGGPISRGMRGALARSG